MAAPPSWRHRFSQVPELLSLAGASGEEPMRRGSLALLLCLIGTLRTTAREAPLLDFEDALAGWTASGTEFEGQSVLVCRGVRSPAIENRIVIPCLSNSSRSLVSFGSFLSHEVNIASRYRAQASDAIRTTSNPAATS